MRNIPQGPGSWWTLPGPYRLVEMVADDLDQGRCVVVRLPQHLPTGFYEAVSRQLEWCSSQPQRWRRFSNIFAGEDAQAEIKALYDWLNLEEDGFIENKSIAHLCAQPGFRGSRILLQNLPVQAVESWSRFLAEYQHELQNQPHICRTTFLLILEGETTALAPAPNANLTVHSYGDHTTVDDVRLLLRFANMQMPKYNEPLLISQLRQAIATSLSPADPIIALALTDLSIDELLQPVNFLKQQAASRGWQLNSAALQLPEPSPAVLAILWATGGWTRQENRPCLHSAVWALHGREEIIQSRIWEGQLTIVLPFLEHRRHFLLTQYRTDLESLLPHTKLVGKREEIVNDIAELELGDMYFLRTRPALARHGSTLTDELELLRHCRVELAHQRPIKEECMQALARLDS